MSIRIQRRRTKGWRMPANTINVTRPGRFGNPYTTKSGLTAEEAVRLYRTFTIGQMSPEQLQQFIEPLRGKNLACWCPLIDKNGNKAPCHADVLLELLKETQHW